MKKAYVVALIIFILILVGYTYEEKGQVDPRTGYKVEIDDGEPSELKEVYVTIWPVNPRDEEYGHTFGELNNDTDYKDEEIIEIKALFQEGKDGAPKVGLYGFGLTDSNSIMSLRGHSTRSASQKSYKFKLDKDVGPWNGNEEVNLNKHPGDYTRVRNKLSFDLLKKVPGAISPKTQYIQLFIKDLGSGTFTENFQDYGLFTLVENIDKDFLENHGLDKKGSLYKAENFSFRRDDEILKLKDDKDYDEKAFEKILETKGDNDHKKLLNMLDALNDPLIHIDDVIDKYFDRDNYVTWLAVNILMGNYDTITQNFYLYSPSTETKFYFVFWDFDGSLGYSDQSEEHKKFRAPWQEGLSNYWQVVLHQKFLKNNKNREELNNKIEEIKKIFSDDEINNLISLYEPIIVSKLSHDPDKRYIPWDIEKIKSELHRFPDIIEANYMVYKENIEKPMPVSMVPPENLGNYLIFRWDSSYDLQGDYVEYKLEISSDLNFTDIIYSREGITDTELIVKDLPAGTYYSRLYIRDSKGNMQTTFNLFRDVNGNRYSGIQEFVAFKPN